MSSSNQDNWLSNYYNRIQTDCTISFERRDRITNWAYAILAAVVAAYAGFFADGSFVIPLGRFGLVAGVLFVLIRFFFLSMIAYGYFLRGRYLRTRIEEYWMNGKPSLEEIKKDIETYDHGKKIPKTGRNRLTGQIRSGFFLILAIPTIPLAIELYLDLNLQYFIIIGFLAAYVLVEIYNFRSYDQTQTVVSS
jgi:hypothetical protein